MIFQKGNHLKVNLSFKVDSMELDIISKYTYLEIVFITGGSFNTT